MSFEKDFQTLKFGNEEFCLTSPYDSKTRELIANENITVPGNTKIIVRACFKNRTGFTIGLVPPLKNDRNRFFDKIYQ